MPTPSVTIRVRVPFVDVDSSGRIHFTAMFRYMEVAEHELMRAIGLPYITSRWDTAFPRVHLSADFRAAVTYDMLLEVVVRVERVGRSSWTLAYTMRRAPDDDVAPGAPPGAVVAEGRMTIAAMDPATERATPLPEALRRALTGEDSVTRDA